MCVQSEMLRIIALIVIDDFNFSDRRNRVHWETVPSNVMSIFDINLLCVGMDCNVCSEKVRLFKNLQ